MRLRHYQTWKLEFLFVSPEQWQRDHDTHFWLKQYEVLDVHEAEAVLRRLAARDRDALMRLARELNGHGSHASSNPLPELIRQLGRSQGAGSQPRFASFYVARSKRERAQVPDLDPWKKVREGIEAAERAPRGFVVVEAVDDAQAVVSGLRLEILLADGEMRSVRTNAQGQVRLDPIPQGQCHIRVPDLDGSSWRPEPAAPSTRVDRGRRSRHIVQTGESLTRIAHQHGIRDWRAVWQSADNAQLRKKRKNPNILWPGDELTLPGIAVHEIVRPTDATHRLVIHELLVEFRVILQDHNQIPFANESYELRSSSLPDREPRNGQTDGQGKLVERLPSRVTSVEVALPSRKLRWSFLLKNLHELRSAEAERNPANDADRALSTKGVQARLNALGFPCGAIDGVLGPRTRAALALFQGNEAAPPPGDDDEPKPSPQPELEPTLLAQLDDAFEVVA